MVSNGTCVVVGAGDGLGLSIARRFGQGGFRAALIARNRANLDKLCAILAAEGIEARGFCADASDAVGLAATLREIEREFGPIEVLEYSPEPHTPPKDLRKWMPSTMTLEEADFRMRLSCFGAVAASQAVLPGMLARKSGTILVTGSGSGIHPIKTLCAVAMSMAALRNFAISLNQEVGDKGVHVANVTLSLLVEPGDPYGDPDLLAETYWRLHCERNVPDFEITTPLDAHQHHLDDMVKYGIELPQD